MPLKIPLKPFNFVEMSLLYLQSDKWDLRQTFRNCSTDIVPGEVTALCIRQTY